MKLKSIQVKNYRSVEDSEKFSIDNITCLVGKNESGKTAILKAIEGIKPFEKNSQYDKIIDYPRRHLSEYDARHDGSEAVVCVSEWELDGDDITALEEEFGKDCLDASIVKISKYYEDSSSWGIKLNERNIVKHLCGQHKLDAIEQTAIKDCNTALEIYKKIEKSDAPSEKLDAIKNNIERFRDQKPVLTAIDILSKRMPSFVYFSHYSRMSGEVSIDQYKECKENSTIAEGDEVFGDFLDLAGTSIEEIENVDKHENFRSKIEAASNSITDQIFEYWTQNKNLEIEFDVGQGKPGDPPPFDSGTVMRARVKNTIHRVSVPFSERSAGFIWFFSFLVHFSQVKKNYSNKNANVIVLLDEPGLTLHAKAQYDLLRYIKEKLSPNYQVIYTTHSPFMIIPDQLESIRTVEDVVIEKLGERPEIFGTKVSSDFLKTSHDTIFPLQSALGYEISQTLFIGKKVVLVEGPSDILYLQAMSNILKEKGKNNLDGWTICPAGGIDKLAPFINLFFTHGEKKEIVVIADYQEGHKNKVRKLRESNMEVSVFLYSDFCEKEEADVEDLFDEVLYLDILNKSCNINVNLKAIDTKKRVIKEIELKNGSFSHYAPSDWLLRNSDVLREDSDEINKTLDRFECLFKKVNGN